MTAFDLGGPLPLGQTVVLQASAGTGKTHAVATLAARAIAEGVVTLDQLMVITFSSASTRELRSRVRHRLAQLSEALDRAVTGAPPTDPAWQAVVATTAVSAAAQRIAAALVGFDAAMICTTHQFCDRMLTELGVLADHDPEAIAVENVDDLVEQAVTDEYLARYARTPSVPFDHPTAMRIGRSADDNPYLPLIPATGGTPRGEERRSFAAAVRERVEHRKRQVGVYTFDDMQTRLLDALRHPVVGAAARERVRHRFPLVLVDEFQDTDPVQWEILRASFVSDESDRATTVVLIGDPKQSIYGFRGAGVHAYLDAVRDHVAQDLGVNRRTTPELVQAVQTVFAGAQLGAPEITVGPVESLVDAQRLDVDGPWRHAMRIRVQPGASIRSSNHSRAVDADLTDDIGRLLASGARLVGGGENRPLRADDIAVIVTSNRRGRAIHAQLARAEIPAVFTGVLSVLTSPAAEDWRKLLLAIDRPRQAAVRVAALTDLAGWTLADLIAADEDALAGLTGEIRRWGRLLRGDGVAGLMQVLLAEGLAARVVQLPDGDRRLTDLRHVAELLQSEQLRSGLTPPGLAAWLELESHGTASRNDDRSRRLETDDAAVRILTVHQAKGLEFAVVYLPELATRFVRSIGDKPIQLHEQRQGRSVRVLDIGGTAEPGRQERERAYRAEEDGEGLRALYVALTRAKCHVTAWWGRTDRTAETPLQRVLFRPPGPSVPARVDLRNDLDPATRLAGADILVEEFGTRDRQATSRTPWTAGSVEPLRLTRVVETDWRRTSYSAITAPAHGFFSTESPLLVDEPPTSADLAPDDSDGAAPIPVLSEGASDPALEALSPMAALPGGVAFGSLVHVVFETFDPHSATPADDLARIVAKEAARLPVPGVTESELVAGLLPVLATPLGPLADGLTLSDIPARDRLAELDFELPLGNDTSGATVRMIAATLDAWLPDDDLLRGYGERLRAAPLDQSALRGYLTGSIDVALRIGGRFLVIDYKTNRLGAPGSPIILQSYTPASMAEAMMEAHYPLQALLYAVALHRFLRWRQPSYDPEVHLGGMLYLFVRGMAGPDTPVVDGMPCGVFSWRPPTGLVLALSDVLAGAR
jgi:exodeoxyribonuclease V beta subunit